MAHLFALDVTDQFASLLEAILASFRLLSCRYHKKGKTSHASAFYSSLCRVSVELGRSNSLICTWVESVTSSTVII